MFPRGEMISQGSYSSTNRIKRRRPTACPTADLSPNLETNVQVYRLEDDNTAR